MDEVVSLVGMRAASFFFVAGAAGGSVEGAADGAGGVGVGAGEGRG